MDKEPLEGGRIEIDAGIDGMVLRELTPEDAQAYFNLIDYDREHFRRVGEGETVDKYQHVEDVLDSFNKRPDRKRFGIWADDVMVGSINYEPSGKDEVTIGYWVGKEHTGHGYAAKAVRTLTPYVFERGWQEAQAWARLDNMASRKALLYSGYEECGIDTAGIYAQYRAYRHSYGIQPRRTIG